jgi:CRISPR-associated protein Cas6
VVSENVFPVVDCAFGLYAASGDATLPADNGYLLYAAISRVLPLVHAGDEIGIHPLRGQLVGNRSLLLPRRARLTFRVPVGLIGSLIPIAGRTLIVAGVPLQVGTPSIRPLAPSGVLSSRLVVIRGFQEPDTFISAARRQMDKLGVAGDAQLVRRRSPDSFEPGGKGGQGGWVRRTLRVKDREIVGFAVEVTGLSDQDSLKLQEAGLGGRRKFGCGVFVPKRTR